MLIGGGVAGLLVALAIVSVGSVAAYWKSDAVALAMSRAKLADETEYARLHNLVEGLCIATNEESTSKTPHPGKRTMLFRKRSEPALVRY